MPPKPPKAEDESAGATERGSFDAGEAWDAVDLAATFQDAGSDEFQGPEGFVRAFWHRSPLGAELIAWRDAGGALLQAQLDVRGEVAHWDRERGLRTGLVVESEIAPGASEEEVRFDSSPVAAALERAKRIVQAMESLDASERRELASVFSGELVPAAPQASPPPIASIPKGDLRRRWRAQPSSRGAPAWWAMILRLFGRSRGPRG